MESARQNLFADYCDANDNNDDEDDDANDNDDNDNYGGLNDDVAFCI